MKNADDYYAKLQSAAAYNDGRPKIFRNEVAATSDAPIGTAVEQESQFPKIENKDYTLTMMTPQVQPTCETSGMGFIQNKIKGTLFDFEWLTNYATNVI